MCGRYALDAVPEQLVELFELANELDFKPRYNIAPSQLNPVIQHTTVEGRVALLAKWGLLPSWAKDPKMVKPINAKSETAASGPMFRAAFRRNRILVPTSGYYEWKAQGSTKQPYFIRLADSAPFAFGGLLEHWKGDAGVVVTYTILTTAANELMATVHDRMPVIIRPADYSTWLDPALTDPEAVRSLTLPYPSDEMDKYAVSTRVNKPSVDDATLIEAVA